MDKLYEWAFEYKRTKLWEVLLDSHVFAVRLTDGRIGYICIMGALGEHCALGLYIGEDGFDSLRMVAEADEMNMTAFEFQETLAQQKCLQCFFVGKDEIPEEEREEVKRYARSHGIKLAGKNTYPQFRKFVPNCIPWILQTEKEQEDLCEALEAAIKMAKLLKGKRPWELGFGTCNSKTVQMPLLKKQKGEYVLGKTGVPKVQEKVYPHPQAQNDVGIAKLKKINKSGTWECDVVMLPSPVQHEPDEIPHYPYTFLIVESDTGYMVPVGTVNDYEDSAEELLDLFINALLTQKICPEKIQARNERTYAFIEAFCEKMGIPASIGWFLPELDEVEDELMEQLEFSEEEGMDKVLDMLDEMLNMDEEFFQTLPEDMAQQLKMLADQGVLPEELGNKIHQVFQPNITELRGDDEASIGGKGKSKGKSGKKGKGKIVKSDRWGKKGPEQPEH